MSSVQQIPIPGQASHHSSSSNLRTRVCHVSMCLTTGGLERLLVEFARRTSRQQFELTFVALGEIGQPAREIEKLGLEVVSLAEKASGRFGRIKALRRLFVDRNIDVIHSHNTYAHFHAALAGQAAGVHGILNTQHGRGCGNHWKQRTDFFIANRFTDRILSVSEDSARICRRQDWFSKSKIETLWNGIDVDRFRYHGPVTEPRAITVSRLSPEKDLPTLLRAVKLVIAQHPDFHLTVVGDGSERSLLENLSRELQLTSHVTFLGERTDIPDLLAQSALYVSSSSTEGISLTLLEAMAVGLPIVTTRVGGNPEVVADGETGYLVPPGNPSALAEKISLHLTSPHTWPEMSQLARHKVEHQFHVDRMIREYEALYRTIMSESWGKTR